jgi:hypothetical protein
MKKLVIFSTFCILAANFAHAEIVQQFKDPTFSGNGWATQVLTLQQMEQNQKAANQAKLDAAAAQAKADAAQTPIAKFMSLFSSQVYSQLATQLSNNLFSTCKDSSGAAIPGCNPATTGTFKVDATTTVNWYKTVNDPAYNGQSSVTLKVVNTTDPSQNTTLTVPIASFAF